MCATNITTINAKGNIKTCKHLQICNKNAFSQCNSEGTYDVAIVMLSMFIVLVKLHRDPINVTPGDQIAC